MSCCAHASPASPAPITTTSATDEADEPPVVADDPEDADVFVDEFVDVLVDEAERDAVVDADVTVGGDGLGERELEPESEASHEEAVYPRTPAARR